MSEQGTDSPPLASNVPPLPPTPAEAKTSGLAIASLILGILGLFSCGLTALVGIVLGICGLTAINNSKGRLKGGGLATAGIAVSGLMIVVLPIIAILAGMLLPALGRARDEARKAQCKSHLKQIGTAANIWLVKFGGDEKFPPSLKALMDDGIVAEPRLFICPAVDIDTARNPGEFVRNYECIQDRAGFTITESMGGSHLPMAWDMPGNHYDGFNVVYFDSHVEFHPDDDSETVRRQFLAEIDAWIEENRPGGDGEVKAL